MLSFGFPAKFHHDQGGEFENQLLNRLEQLCGVKYSQTTPCHPQGNGQVERFNGTLLDMLCTLPENQKTRWKDHVNNVGNAYNCARNYETGFSAFFLLFGHQLTLFSTENCPTPATNSTSQNGKALCKKHIAWLDKV